MPGRDLRSRAGLNFGEEFLKLIQVLLEFYLEDLAYGKSHLRLGWAN